MKTTDSDVTTIDQYIVGFPEETQRILAELRAAIRQAAPQASEKISYQMPTFYLNGNLIHFAAYKQHIGLYPGPLGVSAFAEELRGYKTSKGAIQFPIDEPMPLDLVKRIVEFCVQNSLAKATSRPSVQAVETAATTAKTSASVRLRLGSLADRHAEVSVEPSASAG